MTLADELILECSTGDKDKLNSLLFSTGLSELVGEYVKMIDDRDSESGWTPLHRALYQGHVGTAAKLVEHRCQTKLRDNEGLTPFGLLATMVPSMVLERNTGGPSVLSTWGSNSNLLLGHSEGGNKPQPEKLDLVARGTRLEVADIIVGKFHTVALSRCGSVFTWGIGRDGRLGVEGVESSVTPVHVTGLADVKCKRIVASNDHTLVLTMSGRVHGFGGNSVRGLLRFSLFASPSFADILHSLLRMANWVSEIRRSARVSTKW